MKIRPAAENAPITDHTNSPQLVLIAAERAVGLLLLQRRVSEYLFHDAFPSSSQFDDCSEADLARAAGLSSNFNYTQVQFQLTRVVNEGSHARGRQDAALIWGNFERLRVLSMAKCQMVTDCQRGQDPMQSLIRRKSTSCGRRIEKSIAIDKFGWWFPIANNWLYRGRLVDCWPFALHYDAAVRPAAAFDDNLAEVPTSARHFRTLMIDNTAIATTNMTTAVGSGMEVVAWAPDPLAADHPSDVARPKFARQMS
jgi:hypothetical protein